jgi:hypothetical protein
MLFKLCTYYRNHQNGPAPPFDAEAFIKEYDGEVKEFYRGKNRRK